MLFLTLLLILVMGRVQTRRPPSKWARSVVKGRRLFNRHDSTARCARAACTWPLLHVRATADPLAAGSPSEHPVCSATATLFPSPSKFTPDLYVVRSRECAGLAPGLAASAVANSAGVEVLLWMTAFPSPTEGFCTGSEKVTAARIDAINKQFGQIFPTGYPQPRGDSPF